MNIMSIKNALKVESMEMAEIFQVESVNGEKRVNRWGFFAKQGNGECAIYKPQTISCLAEDLFDTINATEPPSAIIIVTETEVANFLRSVGEIHGIAAVEVDENTACGWYFDTIISE